MGKRQIDVDAEGVCTRPLDLLMSDLSTQYGVGGIRPDDWFGAGAAERQGKPVWVRLWRYSAIRGGRAASAWHPAEKTLKHEPQRNPEPEREEQGRRPVLPPVCPPQPSTYTNPMGEQSPVLCGPPPFARKDAQDLVDWRNNSRPPVMPGTPIASPLAAAFPATPSEERLRRQQDGWLRWNVAMPYAGWLFVATLDNGGIIGPLHLAELAVGERPVKWIRVNPMLDGDCGGQSY